MCARIGTHSCVDKRARIGCTSYSWVCTKNNVELAFCRAVTVLCVTVCVDACELDRFLCLRACKTWTHILNSAPPWRFANNRRGHARLRTYICYTSIARKTCTQAPPQPGLKLFWICARRIYINTYVHKLQLNGNFLLPLAQNFLLLRK